MCVCVCVCGTVAEKASMEDEGLDALDAFMMSMKSGGMDSRTRMELKRRAVELRQQRVQLERLAAVAKPCSLPPIVSKLVVVTILLMIIIIIIAIIVIVIVIAKVRSYDLLRKI